MLFVLRPLVKFLTTTTHQEYDLAKLLPSEMLNADQPAKALPEATDAKQIEAIEGGAAVAQIGLNTDQQTTGETPKKSGITGIEPSIDLEQFEEVVAENVRLVKQDPQQAALLIRYWLNDGKI
jgi:flagellar biosynthesis/type III secretory pathway M-ring protein FliF/YscJ